MRAANTPKFQHLHRIWTWYSTHNVEYDSLNSHPYSCRRKSIERNLLPTMETRRFGRVPAAAEFGHVL